MGCAADRDQGAIETFDAYLAPEPGPKGKWTNKFHLRDGNGRKGLSFQFGDDQVESINTRRRTGSRVEYSDKKPMKAVPEEASRGGVMGKMTVYPASPSKAPSMLSELSQNTPPRKESSDHEKLDSNGGGKESRTDQKNSSSDEEDDSVTIDHITPGQKNNPFSTSPLPDPDNAVDSLLLPKPLDQLPKPMSDDEILDGGFVSTTNLPPYKNDSDPPPLEEDSSDPMKLPYNRMVNTGLSTFDLKKTMLSPKVENVNSDPPLKLKLADSSSQWHNPETGEHEEDSPLKEEKTTSLPPTVRIISEESDAAKTPTPPPDEVLPDSVGVLIDSPPTEQSMKLETVISQSPRASKLPELSTAL